MWQFIVFQIIMAIVLLLAIIMLIVKSIKFYKQLNKEL